MTCQAHYGDDVFEITYDDTGVSSIVRYPHGLDGRGELVSFDDLDPQAQSTIFNRLRRALSNDKRTYPDQHHEDRP